MVNVIIRCLSPTGLTVKMKKKVILFIKCVEDVAVAALGGALARAAPMMVATGAPHLRVDRGAIASTPGSAEQ
ncbi:hypothetical protein E3N88_43863 [Mikania micrantha]|uniref:Uncharacterized protein n=1 Tax=Mikania micrantha TaxID=192012 RepID=A0A5N6LFW9_9ASTR|nr:hypothetical protein E3N88_43863 [Mikania micrantha]